MIRLISFSKLQDVWANKLWPGRPVVDSNSAMVYQSGEVSTLITDTRNMSTAFIGFGYYIRDTLVGVNGGHRCADNSFRSRGLWVDPEFRGRSIGQQLLGATIDYADGILCDFIWSFPRKTSEKTYVSAGFQITSNWISSETSDLNAFCRKDLSE